MKIKIKDHDVRRNIKNAYNRLTSGKTRIIEITVDEINFNNIDIYDVGAKFIANGIATAPSIEILNLGKEFLIH